MRRPLNSAMAMRRESGAGILAQPGSVMPKRFRETGHGGRRAHHRAVAGGARDAAFDLAASSSSVSRPVR